MADSKDLKKIEKALGKISQQQEEILTRLERLEAEEPSAESMPREALISFLDQFRAGEALGEASLGAWIEVSNTACVKGGLRTVQQREGMHARLLEARLKELGPVLEGGDPVEGRGVFHAQPAACSVCHRIGRFGGTLGPDLSTIGQVRSRKNLLEAIVFPSATFARGYEPVQVGTRSEGSFHGVIRDEKDDEIILGLADGSDRRIARASIASTRWASVSSMPQGIDQVLKINQLRSLLAYLESMNGKDSSP